MVDEVKTQEPAARRVIGATPENAAQMRAAIRAWPELHALVQQLQADGLFPGLRGVQFGLTGAPEWVAGGLDSLAPQKTLAGPIPAAVEG